MLKKQTVIISYLFFGEKLVGWKLIGILMVIGSVIIVQLDRLIAKGRYKKTDLKNRTKIRIG